MVPLRKLTGLDVYAFIDSDSDQAHTFTTYLGYWEALAAVVGSRYGDPPFAGIQVDLVARPAFAALRGNRVRSHDEARRLLLNAWNSELALYMVDDDDRRLAAANQWNSVFAYYATGRAALGWLAIRDGSAPTRHRALLNAMAALASTSLLPAPWRLTCTRARSAMYANFPTAPGPCSPLSVSADPHDRIGMMLRTTRDRRVTELVEDVKRRGKLTRAPNGEYARQDGSAATTVFDFLWRSRTRANYGDPSMFYMGTLTQDRSVRYIEPIRSFTAATMFLFEALAAERAPDVVREAAVHYISRDRTGITDDVLVPRLRVLGLV